MADPIGCSAGCERRVADMDAASAAGWENLPITGRWRCPNCTQELQVVNDMVACAAVLDAQPVPQDGRKFWDGRQIVG